MRNTITYITTVWAFTIAAIAGLFALDPGTDPARFNFEPGTIVMSSADPVCTEDMDCWDCETMGNRVCGPLTRNDDRQDNDR